MPDLRWMFVVWGLVLAVFGLVAIWQWQRRQRFRHWRITDGKIISAGSAMQANAPADSNFDSSDSELLRVPHVTFEYHVQGKTFRSSRISTVVVDPRYIPAKATLARYPVGAGVPVYYDPEDPGSAALERTFRTSDYVTFGWLLLLGLLGPWLVAVFFYQIYGWVQPRMSDVAGSSFVTGIIGLGTVFFILAIGCLGTVVRSLTWPATKGRIESAGVSSFHVSMGETYRTAYKPRVLYKYEVGGETFTSDRIHFGFVLGGTSERQAKRIAGRYRRRDEVTVYYNPRKPEDAVLRRTASGTLLFMILAATFLGGAWLIVR